MLPILGGKFSEIVKIGEAIEDGLRTGKIIRMTLRDESLRPFRRKKEDVSSVSFEPSHKSKRHVGLNVRKSLPSKTYPLAPQKPYSIRPSYQSPPSNYPNYQASLPNHQILYKITKLHYQIIQVSKLHFQISKCSIKLPSCISKLSKCSIKFPSCIAKLPKHPP